MFGQPALCGLARLVEQHAPRLEEHNPVRVLEDAPRTLLGDDHRDAEGAHELEERVRRLGIELRRGLVQQQQLRLERKRRCETDPLELAAGKVRHVAVDETIGADSSQGMVRSGQDLVRSSADALEAECDLARNPAQHDLLFGILEDARDGPRELRRSHRSRVATGDLDPSFVASAVEMGHEAGERAQQGRLARPGRTEERDDLPCADLERNLA